MNDKGLKKTVFSGGLWTFLSSTGTQLIGFIVTAVMARLLTPGDFGIVAICSVFSGFIALFQDLGMASAIIQRKDTSEDYLSTSFSVSILAGVGLAAGLVLLSPAVAWFYDEEVLKPILIVSSLGFIISPFISIHTSLLTKALEFKKIAFITVVTQVITSAFSIILAYMGYGVWSLVLGKTLGQPLVIPVVWHMVRWRPRFRIVKKCFNDLFGFSSNLLGFNLLNYFSRNMDNLIVGKYLGAQPLGYYSISYNLMLKPLQLISWSLGKVLFPVFSSLQDDPERTRNAYLKVVRSISLITFPMMTGLIIVAEELILTVYGEQWRPAVKPLQLLCLVGALQSVGTIAGIIYNSHGRTDITFKLGAVNTFLILIAFAVGIRWGLTGLITGYIISMVPIFLSGQYFANRLIGLSMSTFFKTLVPASLSSVMMVMVLLAFRYINVKSLHLDFTPALFAFIAVGVASYIIVAAKVLRIPEANEAIDLVRKRL